MADEFIATLAFLVFRYQGALDYVFYEPARLKVQRQIPLPSEEELQGWIPSKRFPSDHLSVSKTACSGLSNIWSSLRVIQLRKITVHFALAKSWPGLNLDLFPASVSSCVVQPKHSMLISSRKTLIAVQTSLGAGSLAKPGPLHCSGFFVAQIMHCGIVRQRC